MPPAAAPGQGPEARVDRRDDGQGDEVGVLRAARLRGAIPGDGRQVAAAHAVVGGGADHDHRRQGALGLRPIEPGIQAPAAVPVFARADLRGQRRVEAGGRRVPVEQILAVVEVEDGVAPPVRAIVAGRQIDEDPLRALERRCGQGEALEAVRGGRAVARQRDGRGRAAGRQAGVERGQQSDREAPSGHGGRPRTVRPRRPGRTGGGSRGRLP